MQVDAGQIGKNAITLRWYGRDGRIDWLAPWNATIECVLTWSLTESIIELAQCAAKKIEGEKDANWPTAICQSV